MEVTRKSSPLKAWDDPAWQRKLTKTLTVSRVDANIPTEKVRGRKPWCLALTMPDAFTDVSDVDGLPAGRTLLLSEFDVLELVKYLLEPQVALWSDNPDLQEPGTFAARLYVQPGMIAIVESDKTSDFAIVNAESQWSPEYFERQHSFDPKKTGGLPARKIHTLPWRLTPDGNKHHQFELRQADIDRR